MNTTCNEIRTSLASISNVLIDMRNDVAACARLYHIACQDMAKGKVSIGQACKAKENYNLALDRLNSFNSCFQETFAGQFFG